MNNLQCLDDSSANGSDVLLSAANSNSTLLSSHPARIAMLLFALAHIIFTNKVILHNQELRKRINSQPWFGVQLLLHPVIVGMTVSSQISQVMNGGHLLGFHLYLTSAPSQWICRSYRHSSSSYVKHSVIYIMPVLFWHA